MSGFYGEETGGGAWGALWDSAVLGSPGGRGATEVPRPELEWMSRDPFPTRGGSTCLLRALT